MAIMKERMLALQIFELWERPGEAGTKPSHYVKCIYNHNELSLAHHPNGMCSSPELGQWRHPLSKQHSAAAIMHET